MAGFVFPFTPKLPKGLMTPVVKTYYVINNKAFKPAIFLPPNPLKGALELQIIEMTHSMTGSNSPPLRDFFTPKPPKGGFRAPNH
jgi:hypothetical protein